MSDRGFWDDDRGSAPVEFVMVAALLTALTLGVIQLGIVTYYDGTNTVFGNQNDELTD